MKNVQQTTKIRVAITSVDHSTMSVVVRDSNGDSDCGAPGGAQIQGCSGSSNIATGYPEENGPNVGSAGAGWPLYVRSQAGGTRLRRTRPERDRECGTPVDL